MNIELERFGEDLTRSRVEPSNEIEYIELEVGRTDRTIAIGKDIPSAVKVELIAILREYKEIFA